MVKYKLNRDEIDFEKKLGLKEIINYINKLNESSKIIHNGIGTPCSNYKIEEVINQYGEFILGLIPSEVLPYHPNSRRKKKVEELFEEPVNLTLIPPILVEDYKYSNNRNYMVLLDGKTRSGIAYEKNVPLLGYVPEKVLSKIPGLEIIK